MAGEEDARGYTWETEYERTWEALKEDDEGALQPAISDMVHRAKRRKLLERRSNIRLGMMRHVFLVVDMSEVMGNMDLKPTRLHASLKLLEHFIEEYFDQNPISQLGIITTKNKRAEKVTELGGNPRRHSTTLLGLKDKVCQGEPSLQNSLELALQTLRHVPGHASREVLVVLGSLTTCDPGDINDTIKSLKSSNVRCSVIGLAGEVHICKKLCRETNGSVVVYLVGSYGVIMDEGHFKDLLLQQVAPPAATSNTESSLIKMGFPHHQQHAGKDKPAMCMCHLDSKTSEGFGSSGYFCPQCNSKYCELPVECKACGLTLVSAPHLARSFHHLFPLDTFQEFHISPMMPDKHRICYACQKYISESSAYQCKHCQHLYCIDCDLFVHDTLHSCPGCAMSRKT